MAKANNKSEKYTHPLNEYVLNYLDHDNTNSALMLTGPWGSGKSYYIRYELARFLDTQPTPRDCVIISLYGVDSLRELSKKIFFAVILKSGERKRREKEEKKEVRAEKRRKRFFWKILAKIFAKKVVGIVKNTIKIHSRTIASQMMKGAEIGSSEKVSEKDVVELYRSVNLTNVLLVFEDLERTKMDVVEVMGYINSLVEEDQAKVLIVANEEEIAGDGIREKKKSEPAGEEDLSEEYVEEPPKPRLIENTPYARIKEKTVSDTLIFYPDKAKTIQNILKEDFKGEPIVDNIMKQPDLIEMIQRAMDEQTDDNFRTFIFAVQKTCDIFRNADDGQLDPRFTSAVLLNVLGYSIKFKKDKLWSTEDGASKEDALSFTRIYIQEHRPLNKEEIQSSQKLYLMNLDIQEADENIKKLSHFQLIREKELKEIIGRIKKELTIHDSNGKEEKPAIPYTIYGTLSDYLSVIDNNLPKLRKDVKECEDLMIANLEKGNYDRDSVLDSLFGVTFGVIFENESLTHAEQFSEEMRKTILKRKQAGDDGVDILERLMKIGHDENRIYATRKSLLGYFDIDKVASALLACDDPSSINRVNNVIYYNYVSLGNAREVFPNDLPSVQKLKNLLEQGKENIEDGVCKYQVNRLIKTLDQAIPKLF